jgi:hypothetical protein
VERFGLEEPQPNGAVGEVADVKVLAASIFVEAVVSEHREFVSNETVNEVADDHFSVLFPLVEAVLGVVEVGAEEIQRRRSTSNAFTSEVGPIAVNSGRLR